MGPRSYLRGEDLREKDDESRALTRETVPAAMLPYPRSALLFWTDDSQFLGQRDLSALEVARVFGLPPWTIGAGIGDSLTYSSVTQQNLAFVGRTPCGPGSCGSSARSRAACSAPARRISTSAWTANVLEIDELRDVSIETTGAYSADAARVELRSKDNNDATRERREDTTMEKTGEHIEAVRGAAEERTPPVRGLRVEEREETSEVRSYDEPGCERGGRQLALVPNRDMSEVRDKLRANRSHRTRPRS